jgi:hypothetical protein
MFENLLQLDKARSHLVALILGASHVDYVEQFLFDKNTRLSRLL